MLEKSTYRIMCLFYTPSPRFHYQYNLIFNTSSISHDWFDNKVLRSFTNYHILQKK